MAPRPRSKYRSKAGRLAEKYGVRLDQLDEVLELGNEIYRKMVKVGLVTASKDHARVLAARIIRAR